MLKQNKEVKTESEMGKTSPHKSSTGCENSVSLGKEVLHVQGISLGEQQGVERLYV